MIPVFGIPTSYQQRRCQRPDLEQCMSQVWPNYCQPSQRRGTGFQGVADLHHQIFKFLQEYEQHYSNSHKEENGKMQRKENCKENEPEAKSEKSSSKAKSDAQCKTSTDFKNGCHNLMDILHNATRSFENAGKDMESKRWRKEVDCRGFKSRHIRVKVDAHLLLINANKSEESMYGVSTSNMRKSVPLPDNIDTKRIACKLSPQGVLVVEAPYLDAKAREINKHDFMRDLMSTILPGLEDVLTNHLGCPASKNENQKTAEKSVEKTNTDKSGENVKKDENSDQQEAENRPVQDERKDEEETCKMNLVGKDKAVEEKHFVHDGDLADENTDSVHSINGTQILKSEELDISSEASEDSFVILSELEKEADKNYKDSETQIGDMNQTAPVYESDEDDDIVEEKTKADVETHEYNSIKQNDDFKLSESGQFASDPIQDKTPVLSSERKDEQFSDTEVVNDFVYRVKMPSYNPETIQVNFEENGRLLDISASKEKSSEGRANSITKRVQVPSDVNVDKLRCTFQDGTLSIIAPRRNPIRNIPVRQSIV